MTNKDVSVTTRISSDLDGLLQKKAREQGRSKSDIVRQALQAYLQNESDENRYVTYKEMVEYFENRTG